MIKLSELKNSSRGNVNVQRIGRGVGTGRGKTSGRGHKGAGSRAGYKRRYGNEGGQFKMYMKLPIRGFSRARFEKEVMSMNLEQINAFYNDGEVVSYATLKEKGLAKRRLPGGIKILSKGELIKKVSIEANAFSKAAILKLEANKIKYKII